MKMTEESCDGDFKKGEKELKTSFFSFKFEPDHVSALNYFTTAAKGFLKLGLYEKSIKAFSKAFECNGKINDYWTAGSNALQIAEIHLFHLKNTDEGIKFLKSASYNYKVAGKFTTGIKIYNDTATKFMEIQDYKHAEIILNEAINDCFDHPEDRLVRISGEGVFTKLLDVQCGLEKYVDSIKMIDNMIAMQIKFDDNKHTICQNYVKLAMLRIILDEAYLVKDIINKLYQVQDESSFEAIADIQKLTKSIETLNKKDFNFCIQSAFSLYENNLLKAVQKVYAAAEKKKATEVPINLNPNEILPQVQQHHVIDNVGSISNNETKVTINTEASSNIEALNEAPANNNRDNEFL